MNRNTLTLLAACALTVATSASASAQLPSNAMKATPSFYTQKNLVTSTKSLKARIHSKTLSNPWGLVQGPTPFWIADNGAGVSTLYDGNGRVFKVSDGKKKVPFVVSIPSMACRQRRRMSRLQRHDRGVWRRYVHLRCRGWNYFRMAASRRNRSSAPRG
jgi:glucose/arabinose dehydrogenase